MVEAKARKGWKLKAKKYNELHENQSIYAIFLDNIKIYKKAERNIQFLQLKTNHKFGMFHV